MACTHSSQSSSTFLAMPSKQFEWKNWNFSRFLHRTSRWVAVAEEEKQNGTNNQSQNPHNEIFKTMKMKNKLCNFSLRTSLRTISLHAVGCSRDVSEQQQRGGSQVKSLRLTDSTRRSAMTFFVWLTRWDGHECERLSGARGSCKSSEMRKVESTHRKARVQRWEKQRVGNGQRENYAKRNGKSSHAAWKICVSFYTIHLRLQMRTEFGSVFRSWKMETNVKTAPTSSLRRCLLALVWKFRWACTKRENFPSLFNFNRLTSHELT